MNERSVQIYPLTLFIYDVTNWESNHDFIVSFIVFFIVSLDEGASPTSERG